MGPEEYLAHLARVKAAVHIPVIASLNGTHPGSWRDYPQALEQAGADALELNIYHLPTDPNVTGDEVEELALQAVREVKRAVRIPVAVKISPFFSAIAHFAARLDAAGADGIVLFNRFYQPDIDPAALNVVPSLQLSRSSELPLRLRWLAILSGRVRASLAVTGGVHDGADAIKAVMAGAHAVQMVSALLRPRPRVPRHACATRSTRWLEEHEYDSLAQARGSMNLMGCPDPAAYERANYMTDPAGLDGVRARVPAVTRGLDALRRRRPPARRQLDPHPRHPSRRQGPAAGATSTPSGFDSVRFRFLGAKKDLTAEELQLLHRARLRRGTWASLPCGGTRAERSSSASAATSAPRTTDRRAEFALAVVDAWQGRGVGTLLMEHLARLAAADGVERFEADDPGHQPRRCSTSCVALGFRVDENSRAAASYTPGFPSSPRRRPGAPATSAPGARPARACAPCSARARWPWSARRAIRRSIGAALVGQPRPPRIPGRDLSRQPAGRSRSRACARTRRLRRDRASDRPRRRSPCPRRRWKRSWTKCGRRGRARGRRDLGRLRRGVGGGAASSERCATCARARGLRLVGPNCMGVINTDPAVSLDATFAPALPPPGNVGMLSQSGALGVAVLDYARALNIGVSTLRLRRQQGGRLAATTSWPTGRTIRAPR